MYLRKWTLTPLFNLMNQKDVNIHFIITTATIQVVTHLDEKVAGFVDVQQAAHVMDLNKRLYIAQQFVYSAIHHMLRNIRRYKDEVEPFINEITQLKKQVADATDIQTLMGIEGKFALLTINALMRLLKILIFNLQREKNVRLQIQLMHLFHLAIV